MRILLNSALMPTESAAFIAKIEEEKISIIIRKTMQWIKGIFKWLL